MRSLKHYSISNLLRVLLLFASGNAHISCFVHSFDMSFWWSEGFLVVVIKSVFPSLLVLSIGVQPARLFPPSTTFLPWLQESWDRLNQNQRQGPRIGESPVSNDGLALQAPIRMWVASLLRAYITLPSIKTPLNRHWISKWGKTKPPVNHDFVLMGTIMSVWTATILCWLWKFRQHLSLWPHFSSKGSRKIQDGDQSLTLDQTFHTEDLSVHSQHYSIFREKN